MDRIGSKDQLFLKLLLLCERLNPSLSNGIRERAAQPRASKLYRFASLGATARQRVFLASYQQPNQFKLVPAICPLRDVEAAVAVLGSRGRITCAIILLLLMALLGSILYTTRALAEGVSIRAREPEAPADSLVLRKGSFVRDACRLIDRLSRANAIPGDYIARLISVESGFRPTAVSPKGAQGIAQFMPETARLRGLSDPFEPASALKAAIEYLSELRHRFGNLGLAAAAYNAGEKRVEALIAGRSGVPLETRNYVFAITGRQIGDWLGVKHPTAPFSTEQDSNDFIASCARRVRGTFRITPTIATIAVQPWGVQVSESFSRNQAVQIFRALQERLPSIFGTSPPMIIAARNYSMGSALRQRVFIGAASRAEAESKCSALHQKGVACLVRRTGR
jgi:soluble lytic murein transglycosylase-like protein